MVTRRLSPRSGWSQAGAPRRRSQRSNAGVPAPCVTRHTRCVCVCVCLGAACVAALEDEGRCGGPRPSARLGSVSEVSRRRLGGVSEASRRRLGSVSEVSRKCPHLDGLLVARADGKQPRRRGGAVGVGEVLRDPVVCGDAAVAEVAVPLARLPAPPSARRRRALCGRVQHGALREGRRAREGGLAGLQRQEGMRRHGWPAVPPRRDGSGRGSTRPLASACC